MKPRPTTATFTFRFVCLDFIYVLICFSTHLHLRQYVFRRPDVRHPLIAGFAFDDKVTGVIQFPKRCKERLPIHLAGADRDFLAPCAWHLKPSRGSEERRVGKASR